MARQRSVKYPPKQGNLSRKEVKRVVREVIQTRRDGAKSGASTTHTKTPSKPKNTR